jgi:hypothetical protein
MNSPNSYAAQKPQSHQAVADEMNLDMRDPFTRVIVAALYWRAVAEYWRTTATPLPEGNQ